MLNIPVGEDRLVTSYPLEQTNKNCKLVLEHYQNNKDYNYFRSDTAFWRSPPNIPSPEAPETSVGNSCKMTRSTDDIIFSTICNEPAIVVTVYDVGN